MTCTLYIHACMHARSVARERDNAARSWVDALCSFPCVHYIFRPLRLQGYARNGRLFSLIAIFPRQSPANRIRIPLLRNVRLASYRPISLSLSLFFPFSRSLSLTIVSQDWTTLFFVGNIDRFLTFLVRRLSNFSPISRNSLTDLLGNFFLFFFLIITESSSSKLFNFWLVCSSFCLIEASFFVTIKIGVCVSYCVSRRRRKLLEIVFRFCELRFLQKHFWNKEREAYYRWKNTWSLERTKRS